MSNVLSVCNKLGDSACWELAGMLREYGARCSVEDMDNNRDVCEGNTRLVVQAGSGTGDVHQIVGRYPEMDGFSYTVLTAGGKPAELGAAGWTVFVQTVAAGPDRIVFSRTRAADASTPDVQVTARAIYPASGIGNVGRIYLVTLLGGGGQAYLNRELFSHLNPTNNVSPSYVRDLLRQGADPNYAENGVPLLLRLIEDVGCGAQKTGHLPQPRRDYGDSDRRGRPSGRAAALPLRSRPVDHCGVSPLRHSHLVRIYGAPTTRRVDAS